MASTPPTRTTSLLKLRGVTRKEREVLAAVAERLTNPEIAGRLYVSPRTIESHVSSLLRKLDASSRRELADRARELLAEDNDIPDAARRARTTLPASLELLADPATFVGRHGELDQIRAAWRRTCEGHSLTAVVAGEAGIGKSRLVAEVAAEVYREDGQVLFGACFEDTPRPCEPFVHVLREQAAGLPPPEMRRRAATDGRALVQIVPELALLLHAEPPDAQIDSGAARVELLDALAGYLSRSAEATPTLLVIEDLHWSTPTTREAIRHLTRRGGHAPMLTLITTRSTRPDLDDALSVFLADLARLPGVETITLSGLSRPEVAALLAELDPRGDPESVHKETGGNPLFVSELTRGPSRAMSGPLAGILVRRYAQLEAEDLALLDIASVIGTEFGAELLAASAGQPMPEVLETLERAEAAGLVAALPGRPGRFSFVHALFRAARYDALTSARRLRLHRRVADALGKHPDDLTISELARHACIAAPLGGAREAIDHARRAGLAAERALAPAEAADQYERALGVAELLDPPDPELRLELEIRVGEMLLRAGNPRYRDVLRAAAELARRHRDAVALAAVAAAMIQYGVMTTGLAADPEFVAIAEEALAGLGGQRTSTRACVQAALSVEVTHLDPLRSRSLVADALDIARALDDPPTLGRVLLSSRIAGHAPGDIDAMLQSADELIGIGHRTAQRIFTITGLETRAAALREAGDLVGCDEAVEEYAALLGAAELPHIRVFLTLFRSARYALAGDLAAAERTAHEILALAKRGGFDRANWYGSALWTIRHNQNRLARFVPFVRRGVQQQRGIDDYLSGILALAHLQSARMTDAQAELEVLAVGDFVNVRPNFLWKVKLAMLCETAEMTRSPEASARLLELLRPHRGTLAANLVLVFAPVDLALAQAALGVGDYEGAESFAMSAVTASRQRRTPIFLGRELVRLAEARRQLGVVDAEIKPLVDEALNIADSSGAILIRREAEHYGLTGGVDGLPRASRT